MPPIMLATLILCAVAQAPRSPLDFARAELAQAAGSRSGDVSIEVRHRREKESFTIEPRHGKVRIVGSDETGAMYGAFEFAERLRNQGERAWMQKADASPYLRDRGVNLFLTLPWDYAKNDTDNNVEALTDPKRWWFQDEHYWTTLLDLMAHSRLNWLDIHGTWDISVTDAPNLYAYFVTSPTFPKVGVPEDVKAKDLAQLNHVIEMAHARGIRVSLMSYEARFHTPQNPNPPYKATEQNLYKYTREVVEQMIRKTPKLDAIGFRIGESGHGASFFKCYTEAVKNSGRDIPLITRTWVTTKPQVLALARTSKDFTAEIKYNGEQWGAPYIVEGGRMANWGSYSYEDYLSDSGPGRSAKMWEGNPAEGGGTWPAEPYKIVWQVRANGTHRIFPFYNPDWVRRSIKCMKMGTASGYTVEGEDAYFPKSPLYYLANPADKYCDFIHQRDELYWMSWGRLGYDPTTPDSTFDAVVNQWFGEHRTNDLRTGSRDDNLLATLWKKASTIVPLAYMGYALGPDHRDEAPELETGGTEDQFAEGQPFDPLVFRPANFPWDDGRASWFNLASKLANAATATEAARIDTAELPIGVGSNHERFKELARSWRTLMKFADYYSARFDLAAAAATPIDQHARGVAPDYLRSRTLGYLRSASHSAWQRISDSGQEGYRPFTDKLRMHTNTYFWSSQIGQVPKGLETTATPDAVVHNFLAEMHSTGQGNVSEPRGTVKWVAVGDKVRISVDASLKRADPLDWTFREALGPLPKNYGEVAKAFLLVKPLPSSTFWHRQPMTLNGKQFEVTINRPNSGLCIAAQVTMADGYEWRLPSFFAGDTPYLVIPAKAGPTPMIYNTDEALAHLDPAMLTPDKFGTMVIAPRAAKFWGFSRAQKRKLFEGVTRGMELLILQQDFLAKRYSLDFLPKPLKVEANPTPNQFDCGGQLGLQPLTEGGIQWQRFAHSDGWDVYGNGGLARLKLGKGEIWVTSARLMQNATQPDVAEDLKRLLRAFVTPKPAILIDAGTESAFYTTSFWPDLMNELDIPFVTLGEAIAWAQGISSNAVIAGPSADDDVLGGQGSALASAFLRSQVIAASKRPVASSVAAFETVRAHHRRELMRSLGLAPMPPKTPLNLRVTGVIKRDGFRIEKTVIESRPHFYVTMHVYVPDSPLGVDAVLKRPLIMNVNGHWAHKKDEDRIQYRCAFQARQGYIACAVDSPGHSFEGNNLIERRAEGDHNDFKLVEGGTNATGYYVWDTIRALDAMSERADVDMSRVGITGASGGGLGTLYTFAADDRYKVAVPVVYMASLELAPDNGCLCNHVPGTCQVGDRSDVVSIQAPKPVMLIGAELDGEFPPAATRLTREKMAQTWALFGKADDTTVKIFPGGHDYSQPMRESMIGFFNKYLKGGDGAPVPEPPYTVIDPENREILALDPPAADERTMRDLSKEYLDNAPANVTAADAIAVNGGLPNKSPMRYTETGSGHKRDVVFESETGLQTPAILFLPEGTPKGVRIVVDDAGKSSVIHGREPSIITADGYAVLVVDILGVGELAGIELRYPTYLGRSVAFSGGWQLVRAAEAMRRYSPHIELSGRGALATQAVMWAGLQSPKAFDSIVGADCLPNWQAVVTDAVSDAAVQPRAHLCGSLDNLRKQVRNGTFKVAL